MIRIIRKYALADLFRSYKILLNGKEIGHIRNGEEFESETQLGILCLQLQIDWCFSNTVEVEYSGELIEFECGNNYQGKRMFFGVLNIIGTSEGEYLWLKRKEHS